jgi:2-dehydropantoate 2-reductase
MQGSSPRIAVFGAGAIGGFIAAALARSGADVSVVARGAHLQAIRSEGLRVRSDIGDFERRIPASDDLRDFDRIDFVLVAFKAHQWNGVLPQFERAVAQGTVFVTFQNGLPFWYDRARPLESVDPGGRILAAIPYDRILGGVVHASGTLSEPGLIRQSGGMLYPIGELDGRITDRARTLCALFHDAGLQAPIEPDIRRTLWRKLLGNLALNPVSALTRASVHRMLEDPGTRELLRALIDEGLAVARASGVDAGVTAQERLKMAERIGDVKTSMLQDVEAKRALELEPIVGAVRELGKRYGVPVPHIETVYALAKMLEPAACP